MTKDFKPRRWLSNGHLQTIVGNFLRRVNKLSAPATEFVEVPLPPEMHGRYAHVADFQSRILCHCHWQPKETVKRPTVILVHGLEGSSHSQYVIGNANKLFSAGCNVIRMNMRNCGWTDALSGTLYHSGMSCDVKALLDWLIALGIESIAMAGYSMGGNLVLKAVGELGRTAPKQLKSVVAISPPIDLRESADALCDRKNWLYHHRFMRALRVRYCRKRNLFPAIFPHIDLDKIRSVREYDEHVMGPQCGFAGADDYYAQSGAYRVVEKIAVPTLVLHAWDDPFIRLTPSTHEKLVNNPHITLVEPKHGGHCAFLAEPDPAHDYDGYWAEYLLREFVLEHCGC